MTRPPTAGCTMRSPGELVSAIPLPPGAHVVEADRGGARWTRRWIERGCRVTSLAGDEITGPEAERIEWTDKDRGDLVLATATLQSAADPFLALQRLVGLVKPGGILCVRVENLLSLVLGWLQEEQRGHAPERWHPERRRPKRRLYDSGTLKAALLDAGLVDVRCHALAVTATASGRLAACAPLADEDGLYAAIDRGGGARSAAGGCRPAHPGARAPSVAHPPGACRDGFPHPACIAVLSRLFV